MAIKKGDTVLIAKGKDRGKTGKVVKIVTPDKLLVEGLNQYKKHIKPSKKYPQGGIIDTPLPLQVSNVMIICPTCNKAVRVRSLDSGKEKRRVCAKCNEVLDEVK